MLAHPIDATATELQLPETATKQLLLAVCRVEVQLQNKRVKSWARQATKT
jgi:hypothetical protein